MNRRDLMKMFPAVAASSQVAAAQEKKKSSTATGLPLEQFEPKSMLHVKETHVARSRYPVIDFHTHITWSGELTGADKVTFNAHACRLPAGYGPEEYPNHGEPHRRLRRGLREADHKLARSRIPAVLCVFTEPSWSQDPDPDYPKFQADLIEEAHKAGAKGHEDPEDARACFCARTSRPGNWSRIDDPPLRSDVGGLPAALNMPMAIHISDPEAFFLPIDRFNER